MCIYAHLDSLYTRLNQEKYRLEDDIKSGNIKAQEIRQVWITQIEKEIESEKEFLKTKYPEYKIVSEMSDDDIFNELNN
jgi:hypothetical protein